MSASSTARRELPLVTPRPTATSAAERTLPLAEFFQRVGYVTLKLTNGCNLHCTYCNVEAVTPRTPRMSLERFKQVARLLLANSREPFVGLEFHGGEPLLLPDEWFEEAVAYARSLAKQYRKDIEFPLVTNATLLTEERLLRLHRLGIAFCLSADGPPALNDQIRGGGIAVERALRLFHKHRIHTGVLTVLSRANYRHMGEVMDWFADIGVGNFRVNFLQPQGRGDDESQLLTGEEMFEGIQQVLDHMDRTRIRVSEGETLRMLDLFVHGRDPQPRLSCWEFKCQAGRTYCAVNHHGTIYACGTDMSNHPLGHLDADLDDAQYTTVLQRLHHKGDWVIRCFDCSARRVCRHSCATSDYNSETYKEYECRFTKLMYAHLCAHQDKVWRIEQTLQARHHLPPGSAFVPVEQVRVSPI
jgi:uncharacterized protein